MILSRVRLLPQIRYDLEDFVAQQSGVRTDSKFFTKRFLSGENYIVKGFSITGLGLNQATIVMDSATLIFSQNTSDFSWYTAEDSPADIVVADSDLTDGVKNYIELSVVTETNTPVTKALWDPAANSGEGAEFTQEVDTMTDLAISVSVRTGGFSGDPDKIPLAIIEVNGSGTIVGIRDKRKLFFRLGAPGNEDQDFSWASRSEPVISLNISSVIGTFTAGETIAFSSGANATVVTGGTTSITVELPDSDSFAVGDTVTTSGGSGQLDQYSEAFTGADKDIDDFRESLEAIMTEIKLLKGTRFWYQNATMSLDGISQQLNSQMVQAVAGAFYSWDGSNFSISDASGTPADADVLGYLRLFGESNTLSFTRQDGTGGSVVIPIAEDEIVYIELPTSGDRIYSGAGAASTNFKVASITSYVKADNHYWIGYRKLNRLYVRGYGEMEAGETVIISDPQKEDILAQMAANQAMNNQDRGMALISGGTWSWDADIDTLTWSSTAYVQIPGLANSVNTINSAVNTDLNADGKVLYVEVNRSSPGGTLTIQSADISAITLNDNIVIIARRVGNDVIIGSSSFALKDGEFLELDGALAEINRYHSQTAMSPSVSTPKRIIINSSDVIKLNGSKLSLSEKNLILKFDGAQIDFETGSVYESDGITSFLSGANDFTPQTLPVNAYFYYTIAIIPESTNADNTINGQILVIPASSSSGSLSTAPKAPLSNIGINLGEVYVQEDGAGGILDLSYPNIIDLSVGGSGGNEASVVKVDYHDPISTTLPTGASVTIDGQAGVNGDLVLFTNLASGNNKIYELSGVGSSIAWTATLDFNLGSPEDGDMVVVLSGDGFADTLGRFTGTNWVFNDTVRYFSGADYWEQSSLKTSDILNSTTDNIFTVALSNNENMIIDYAVIVGSKKQTGQFIITGNSTDVKYSNHSANLNTLDVDLFADVNSGNIRFRYTSNELVDGSIKYSVKRWSNTAGGPGGIPSYSGATGSSVIAAGSTSDIQYKGATGFLAGDSAFQWDVTNQQLNMNGLKIDKLLGPLTINDNQASAATIVSYDAATYRFAIFEYSIERNGSYRVGRLLIINDGTSASITDDSNSLGSDVDEIAIPFTATISGSNVLLQYTSTSTGFTGNFKYSARRWS